jgi:uncharacterized protein YjiS (DUF1127 family)
MIMQMNIAHAAGQALAQPSGIIGLVGALFARAVHALRTEYAVRKAVSQLQSLDDHLLADIGMDRGEIERIVRSGRQRPWGSGRW